MLLLRSLQFKCSDCSDFPFRLPLFQQFSGLDFKSAVTFLVGENGSGKSTLLEGLAVAADRVAVGAAELPDDQSLEAARRLAGQMKLTWNRRTNRGFFLRAEDFFGYSRRLNRLQQDIRADAQELKQEYAKQGRSAYATSLALGALGGAAGQLRRQYEALEQRSHGESFLDFFSQRVSPVGLYILDEPETPLSPQNQLTLLMLIGQAAREGSQFIIATHSPILMALPGADIYSLDQLPPQLVDYRSLQHVNLTRDFLNNPEAYLRHLLA